MKLEWKIKQESIAGKKLNAKEMKVMKVEARVLEQLKELKNK